jgi:RecA/RadA recombinase
MATSDKTEKAQPFRFDYGAIIKKVEKEFSLIESSPSTERMQTGVFVLDLIHGGGIPPGRMITLAGKESCGKSTTLMTALRTAAHYENLGFINYWDYEGSFDRTYLSQMLNDDKIAKIVDEKLRV